MKKLLAVVLSAAMVLGMSTVAFADSTENVATDITLSVDGNTVSINASGSWNLVNETHVTWDATVTPEKKAQSMDFVGAYMAAGMQGALMVNDTVNGEIILAGAFANTSGALLDYTGVLYTITFPEGTTVDVTCGNDTVTVGAEAPEPSVEPSEDPVEPSVAPTTPADDKKDDVVPTTPADDKKDDVTPTTPADDKTPSQTPSADKKNNTTANPSTTTNKTTAAKTADVAPVATMAVLALAAAAVVVAMKKKVTE